MIVQGCVDYEERNFICPIADKCLRRDSAKIAPRGVTSIVAPYNKDNNKCEYFIGKESDDQE